jgi:choline dehydrogenase
MHRRVDANHLSAAVDRKKSIEAFRWNRQLARQPTLKDWVLQEVPPFNHVETDEQILARAMQLGGTCIHTARAARMGTDTEAVADPQLRVRGVDGLRVADTSVMPTLVSSNTNGPAKMIGLRAAEFILAA